MFATSARVDRTNVARVRRGSPADEVLGLGRAKTRPTCEPTAPDTSSPGPAPPRKPTAPVREPATGDEAAGDPSASAPNQTPAPVMGRGEPPRRVIHPRPTPWLDPDPTALRVGRPPGRHVRIPDLAIARGGVPSAIGVELGVDGHVRRNEIGRGEPVFVVITRATPFDESIGDGPLYAGGDRVEPVRDRYIAGFDFDLGAVSGEPRGSLENRDSRRLILRSGIYVIVSGLQQQYPAARDGDLESVSVVELAHMQINTALRKINLRDCDR